MGLVILRACLSVSLFLHLGPALGSLTIASLLVAFCLLLGLWTPLAAVLQCAIQLATLILLGHFDSGVLAWAGVGLSLALLGPGAFSVDAKLYGRRRVDLNGQEPPE